MLLEILLALPFHDCVCQSLTTQPNLNTGVRLHLAGANSANPANCWTCNLPGHFSHECLHAGAIKDLLSKRFAASRSSNRPRRGRKAS